MQKMDTQERISPKDSDYRPICQKWTIIRHTHVDTVPTNDTVEQRSVQDLRERVQTARIERRMAISELAQRVKCDVETLAAFERGEEIVSEAVQKRLNEVLRL